MSTALQSDVSPLLMSASSFFSVVVSHACLRPRRQKHGPKRPFCNFIVQRPMKPLSKECLCSLQIDGISYRDYNPFANKRPSALLGSFCIPIHLGDIARCFRSWRRNLQLQTWSRFIVFILGAHFPALTAVGAVLVVVVVYVVLTFIAVILFTKFVVAAGLAITGTSTPLALPGSNSSRNGPSPRLCMRGTCCIFVEIALTRSMLMYVRANPNVSD